MSPTPTSIQRPPGTAPSNYFGAGGTAANPTPGSQAYNIDAVTAGIKSGAIPIPGASSGSSSIGTTTSTGATDLPILAPPVQTPSPGNTAPTPLPTNPTSNPSSTNGSSGGQPGSGTVTAGSPPTNPDSTGLSFGQVENFWIQAGGNPQAASMAAAVADASSGLNSGAKRTNPDGTNSIGLWLIPQNGSPPGSTDPLSNARAAVQLSQNGTDWSQWCVAWSDNNCGENNGTYLGSGSNALMSLQGQKPGAGSYSVFGSAPAGNGVGASSAASGGGGSTGITSSSSKLLPIVIIIVITVVIIFLVNRKKQGKDSVQTTQ